MPSSSFSTGGSTTVVGDGSVAAGCHVCGRPDIPSDVSVQPLVAVFSSAGRVGCAAVTAAVVPAAEGSAQGSPVEVSPAADHCAAGGDGGGGDPERSGMEELCKAGSCGTWCPSPPAAHGSISTSGERDGVVVVVGAVTELPVTAVSSRPVLPSSAQGDAHGSMIVE